MISVFNKFTLVCACPLWAGNNFTHSLFQRFYLSARGLTKHHAFVDDTAGEAPETHEEYLKDPGSKLDVMVNIVKHHIQGPGRPLLRNIDPVDRKDNPDVYASWSNNLVPIDNPPSAPPADTPPDKLVVFQMFPKHNLYVEPVSSFK
jgi:hypothetical protein